MDVTYAVCILASRCAEWQLPFCCLSLDVETAFDTARLLPCAAALRAEGASTSSVAAWFRENVFTECSPSIAGGTGDSVRMVRGIRTGGRRSPALWNTLLAPLIRKARAIFALQAPAFLFAPELEAASISIWADNFVLSASDPCTLRRRAQTLARLLLHVGLKFGISSAEWLRNKACKDQFGVAPLFIEGLGDARCSGWALPVMAVVGRRRHTGRNWHKECGLAAGTFFKTDPSPCSTGWKSLPLHVKLASFMARAPGHFRTRCASGQSSGNRAISAGWLMSDATAARGFHGFGVRRKKGVVHEGRWGYLLCGCGSYSYTTATMATWRGRASCFALRRACFTGAHRPGGDPYRRWREHRIRTWVSGAIQFQGGSETCKPLWWHIMGSSGPAWPKIARNGGTAALLLSEPLGSCNNDC